MRCGAVAELRIPGMSAVWGRMRGQRLLAAAVPLLLVATALLLVPEAPRWLRWTAMAALAWWLPGALLVAHARLREVDLPTAGLLALGLGLCWLVAWLLLIHALPGPISRAQLAWFYAAGAAVLAAGLLWRRPLPARPVPLWRMALWKSPCAPGIASSVLHFCIRAPRMKSAYVNISFK